MNVLFPVRVPFELAARLREAHAKLLKVKPDVPLYKLVRLIMYMGMEVLESDNLSPVDIAKYIDQDTVKAGRPRVAAGGC